MKKILILMWMIFGLVQFVSAQSLFTKWPELGTYHEVLSATYHPSENGDVAPLKTRSVELATWAGKLASQPIPKDFNTKSMRKAVRKLKKESVKTDRMARNNKTTNAKLIGQLSKTHDVFHEIIDLSKEPHESHK